LEPRELELGFGFQEGDDRGEPSELGAFELGGGVKLRGRIDRIDVGEHGEAVVYDYKGKAPPGASKWIEDGKLQVALYMRVTEELVGLRVVGGFYQPWPATTCASAACSTATAASSSTASPPTCATTTRVRELLDQALAAALEAAAEAAAGRLQARPDSCAFRGGCQYPTICRCER